MTHVTVTVVHIVSSDFSMVSVTVCPNPMETGLHLVLVILDIDILIAFLRGQGSRFYRYNSSAKTHVVF
jgi:hypothetical protein